MYYIKHEMKQPRRELKIPAARRSIFDDLRGVSSGDKTLLLMLDMTYQTKLC